MKKNLLSSAVKSALGLTAAAVLLPSMPAFAQDNTETVEEVVVTGSLIKRASKFDEGSQVVTMDRASIDAIGSLMIADTLRSSPLNSLGSFNERSGSSAQSNATVNLRGLGSDRSLVLINGRRMPGSPNLGAASVNLNMIPMAAVERMEIMADGGSAVYGSDAVAGVVNMVMRENFEGFEFSSRHGSRSEDDGIEEGMSFITGITGDKGNITFAAEWNRRDAIMDADREYTAAWIRDNGDGRLDTYLDTDGISYYGKTIEIWDPTTGYYDLQAAANCPSDNGFMGPMGAAAFGMPDGSLCTFAYANISANKAELNRVNTYLNANYQITDEIEFYTNAIFSKVDSFGRYAPPAAAWNNMPEDYADVPFDIDALIASGDISVDANGNPNYEVNGYYRWTNIGPRDGLVTDTQYDFVAGFKGDVSDTVSFDVYASHGLYESKEFGNYYLSYPGLDYVLENGIDPFSEEGAGAMRATTSQDNYTALTKVYGNMQFEGSDLFGAGNAIYLVGGEMFSVEYNNQYDSASEAGLVGGSAGNSSGGERDVKAVFAEAVIPTTEQLELNASVRYDDYSDFGSNVSPALSATFLVNEDITLRSRVGKGFRAPSLSELYGPSSFSAEDATDPVTGLSRQWDTYYSTNQDLDAEKSTSFSFGGNWQFADSWDLDVGYWSVEVDDVIAQPSTQSLFYALASGVSLDPSSGIYRVGTGAQTEFYSTSANIGVLNVSGLDVKLNGSVDTSFGMFTLNTLVTHTLSYEEDAYYKGPVQDTVGFNMTPDLKAQAVFGWFYDAHSVNLTVDYIGEHDEFTTVDANGNLVDSGNMLESWTTMNLSYGFDAGDWGAIKVGARNLTNEEPVLDKDGKFSRDHYNLYDNTGRVVYAEYKIQF
ncbi:TonB-dependent receptor domain-containing protein [Biformimicrobium ophioploci]|uniref:TonB-dependent receptor n=1 Tax=Biformimicrobium ophioploci TaxID=3036711 RepID=A0ABQ6LYU8_9GAMM|nr:TonB-dependent receptor [Microbulbifer sp. NKW57]GMG87273.1 TonB-dependent receptor [Microbulbifer sp. NKW57]